MDGKIIPAMDKRKEADGFKVGQRVTTWGKLGTILGFGPGWTDTQVTVFIDLDDAPGNHGTYHSCGSTWVVAA
jgi:hypothetical protein